MAHKKSCQALLLSSKTSTFHFLQNILTRCHRKLKFSISRTGCIISHTCLFLCFPIRQGTYSSPALTSSPSSPDVFSVPPPKCLLCFALCTPPTWFGALIMKNNRLFAGDSNLASLPPVSCAPNVRSHSQNSCTEHFSVLELSR